MYKKKFSAVNNVLIMSKKNNNLSIPDKNLMMFNINFILLNRPAMCVARADFPLKRSHLCVPLDLATTVKAFYKIVSRAVCGLSKQ